MQATGTANKKNQSMTEDEKCINFRPSPNFKHMKKYLKSKFEEMANSSTPNAGMVSPPPTPNTGSNSPPSSEPEKVKPVVQPPLPPNPPPPDSPPQLTLKKEIEDIEYNSTEGEDKGVMGSPDDFSNSRDSINEQSQDRPPDREICRDFIRGECTRPGTCKYVHEFDVKKLDGVYTFCRNYQNAGCTRPHCKYVHATVFEKEYFYRTGYLPPHVLNHHKKGKILLPPPPPPPPEEGPPAPPAPPVPAAPAAPPVPPVFNNPPPTMQPIIPSMPIMSCVPSATLEVNPEDELRNNIPGSLSPLKRKWTDIDEFSNTQRDLETNVQVAKKCKNCDIIEFRIQYNKNKAEEIIRATEEKKKRYAILTKRYNKLLTVLAKLMKATHSMKSPSSAVNISPSLNITTEKEKSLLEQMEAFLMPNNNFSLIGDENSKSAISDNLSFSNVMAKLLFNSGDQSPDVAN